MGRGGTFDERPSKLEGSQAERTVLSWEERWRVKVSKTLKLGWRRLRFALLHQAGC